MNKEILRLAIPNIISNISVPLLSTVDTILMGQISALHLGAVGVGTMIFNFLYWNFGFLRMGTTGMTAQAYGEGSRSKAQQILMQSTVLALTLAALIILLQLPFARLTYWLMNLSEAQLPLVDTYFSIRIWAAPATLMLYALFGWFFGMQNAFFPLLLTIVINVANIVGNVICVKWLDMSVDGVAYATVGAQYLGLIIGLMLLYLRYGRDFVKLDWRQILAWERLQRFMQINGDIFLRTFCLTFAFGFLYSQSSLAGETILAVNTILLQFLNWMSYGVDGFAYAAESLVGKYVGASDSKRLRYAIRQIFIWGMGLAGLFGIAYLFFGGYLVSFFTDELYLIEATGVYLIWMIIFPLLATPCYLWDGIFIGLTAAREMRNSMLLSLLIYLPLHYALFPLLDNHGLWLAFLLFMLARGISLTFYYRRLRLV